MTSGERRLRLETVGYWLIGLGLLIGLGRVWQTEQAYQPMFARQARLLGQLAQFQVEIAHCERLVAVLGASQAEVVRVGGSNPALLRQQLQAHLANAERKFHALRITLEPLLQQSSSPQALHWAVIRAEAEWLQVYSSLQEYLRHDAQSQINLETLHTFSLTRQDSLQKATEALHQAVARWHYAQMRDLNRQRGLAIGFCLLMGGLLAGWVWYFAIRPAQLMSRWLHMPEPFSGEGGSNERFVQSLRGTRWEPLARMLLQQRQRLREVERFMRDLAVGRTPEPLSPQEPSDPLARSSFWLLRRVEEYRRAHNSREAV